MKTKDLITIIFLAVWEPDIIHGISREGPKRQCRGLSFWVQSLKILWFFGISQTVNPVVFGLIGRRIDSFHFRSLPFGGDISTTCLKPKCNGRDMPYSHCTGEGAEEGSNIFDTEIWSSIKSRNKVSIGQLFVPIVVLFKHVILPSVPPDFLFYSSYDLIQLVRFCYSFIIKAFAFGLKSCFIRRISVHLSMRSEIRLRANVIVSIHRNPIILIWFSAFGRAWPVRFGS